jgi:hypothetical protein
MATDDHNSLEIIWRAEGAVPGKDGDPVNPLARAVQQLLEDGKPFNRLAKCFFRGPDGIQRWFGIFVLSAGERAIFFPGYSEFPVGLSGAPAGKDSAARSFILDHISLEKDRSKWHLTTARSTEHIGSFPTVAVDGGAHAWFAMSVRAADQLRVVKETTTALAAVPPGDARRRMEVFTQSREGVVFVELQLHPDAQLGPDDFLHFALYAGPSGFLEQSDIEVAGALRDPNLIASSRVLPDLIPARMSRVELCPELEIQINCVALPGKLAAPMSFMGLGPPKIRTA